MKAIIQRFWREPKPSCNWCPRVTFVLVLWDNKDSSCIEVPDGHNMTKQEVIAYVNQRLNCNVTDLIEFLSEIEVTKKQFRTMDSWKC